MHWLSTSPPKQWEGIKSSTTNLLIANMAASDLLISIFAIPRKIVEIHIGNEKWPFAGPVGQLSCKCIYFLQDIFNSRVDPKSSGYLAG